ncbi:hypothetical protein [Edaphobacter aggregans]|uniref:hypothetical protein n=1 Tax=Edaphobacter aggregans TaxID=570835 RepID=UPI00055721C9|nr:hypothetical protein [Edaphobacter aggregans]
MRGEKFCYYHHDSRKPVADPQRRQARRHCFHIAPPRTRAAIQESIEIITRLAYNEIDPRRAGLLLYALQIATTNIKDHQASNAAPPEVKPETPIANTPVQLNPDQNGHDQQTTVPETKCHPEHPFPACHPERSAAKSKDLRFDSNPLADPSFDREIFPQPQPELPTPSETTAAIFEALAHHSIEPQPGSPEDRKPGPQPAPEILPTLQATEDPLSHTLHQR